MKPMIGGNMPPPTRSMAPDSRINTRAAFFLAANRHAHTAKAEEKRIARIPVTSKLGTIVIAGSPPTILKNADPGQDGKINPLGAMLP